LPRRGPGGRRPRARAGSRHSSGDAISGEEAAVTASAEERSPGERIEMTVSERSIDALGAAL